MQCAPNSNYLKKNLFTNFGHSTNKGVHCTANKLNNVDFCPRGI